MTALQIVPSISAQLAEASYNLRLTTIKSVQEAIFDVSPELADMCDASTGTSLTGKTGLGWGQATSFGFVVAGKGAWQGHYFVSTRGTATFCDGLTDAVAAMEPGPGGHLVHVGFHRCAKSMITQIIETLRTKNPSRIHCIGHSLGGAVANLVAAYLDASVGGVSLYTFGAPRVGQNSFATDLTWSLGEDAINRAYNIADPVPMIPMFPFFHAPYGCEGALVETSGLVRASAHSLATYRPAVAGSSWQSLKRRAMTTPSSIDQMMDAAARWVRIPGSGVAFHLLGKILHGLLSGTGLVLGTAATAGLTLLDQVAVALFSKVEVSPENKERVSRFLDLTADYVALPILKGMSVTVAFLRYMLGKLWDGIRHPAVQALAATF